MINEPPIRGRILDAAGRPLVENRVANVITVDRKLDEKKLDMIVDRLAELLQTPAKEIRKKLEDPRISPYTPVPVAFDVGYDKLAYVSRAPGGLPRGPGGADGDPRVPHGGVAAHVLGYVGEINEEELHRAAEVGEVRARRRHRQERRRADLRVRPARGAGQDARRGRRAGPRAPHLVEHTAEAGQGRQAHHRPRHAAARRAVAGAGDLRGQEHPGQEQQEEVREVQRARRRRVVLDATTGSVVAMASYPTYDPNEFATASRRRPGSR